MLTLQGLRLTKQPFLISEQMAPELYLRVIRIPDQELELHNTEHLQIHWQEKRRHFAKELDILIKKKLYRGKKGLEFTEA